MANFNYEWWTVSVKCLTGTYSYEFKAKNKQNVIRQIKKLEKRRLQYSRNFLGYVKA